jgi:hypothetical protein
VFNTGRKQENDVSKTQPLSRYYEGAEKGLYWRKKGCSGRIIVVVA